MNIRFISFSYTKGGAAIAAKKFAELACQAGNNVYLFSQDDASKFHFIKRLISYFLVFLQIDRNPSKKSLNLFSDERIVKLLKSDFDGIYHIHWINNDTLSIFDFNQ